MKQEDRLAICELCENKNFSSKFGVICSLTSEKPAFESSCENYSGDHKMLAKKRREEEDKQSAIANGTVSEKLEAKHGMNGRIIAGIISIVIALLWFFGGIFLINRIFYYPIFLFGFGIYKIIDGSVKRSVEVKKEKSDLLDEEF